MFERVTMQARDLRASRRFYVLAHAPPELTLEEADEPTRNLHVAFGVPSPDEVDAWWRRLVDAGYESDGEPGPRPEYSPTYYGGFVRDPDGNSAEAVHHENAPPNGIDHLWLRTTDVAAARAYYTSLPEELGLRLVYDSPERIRFAFTGEPGSFSFVLGEPATEHVRLAFRAAGGNVLEADV